MEGVSEKSAPFMEAFMADRSRILWVFDCSSIMYRAFYGIRQRLTGPDGQPTNAIYGIATMMRKFINDWQPASMVMAFDKDSTTTLRKKKYPEYKANRKAMPPELRAQLPGVRELFCSYGAPALESDLYEADDIIGTLRRWAPAGNYKVVMVSGDTDLAQLFGDECVMYDSQRKRWYTHLDLPEMYHGITKTYQVPMVLGLGGDPSDNIPGVPRVGEKTAAQLIAAHGDLDSVIAAAAANYQVWLDAPDDKARKKIKCPVTEQMIAQFKDQAYLSYELALIDWDMPLPGWQGFESSIWKGYEPGRLEAVFKKFGFVSLMENGGRELPPHPADEGATAAPAIPAAEHAAGDTVVATVEPANLRPIPAVVPPPSRREVPDRRAAGTEGFDMTQLEFDYS